MCLAIVRHSLSSSPIAPPRGACDTRRPCKAIEPKTLPHVSVANWVSVAIFPRMLQTQNSFCGVSSGKLCLRRESCPTPKLCGSAVSWLPKGGGRSAERKMGRCCPFPSSNKCLTSSNKNATRNKCIASSNKCLTSSNKKLLGTSALLVVGHCHFS